MVPPKRKKLAPVPGRRGQPRTRVKPKREKPKKEKPIKKKGGAKKKRGEKKKGGEKKGEPRTDAQPAPPAQVSSSEVKKPEIIPKPDLCVIMVLWSFQIVVVLTEAWRYSFTHDAPVEVGYLTQDIYGHSTSSFALMIVITSIMMTVATAFAGKKKYIMLVVGIYIYMLTPLAGIKLLTPQPVEYAVVMISLQVGWYMVTPLRYWLIFHQFFPISYKKSWHIVVINECLILVAEFICKVWIEKNIFKAVYYMIAWIFLTFGMAAWLGALTFLKSAKIMNSTADDFKAIESKYVSTEVKTSFDARQRIEHYAQFSAIIIPSIVFPGFKELTNLAAQTLIEEHLGIRQYRYDLILSLVSMLIIVFLILTILTMIRHEVRDLLGIVLAFAITILASALYAYASTKWPHTWIQPAPQLSTTTATTAATTVRTTTTTMTTTTTTTTKATTTTTEKEWVDDYVRPKPQYGSECLVGLLIPHYPNFYYEVLDRDIGIQFVPGPYEPYKEFVNQTIMRPFKFYLDQNTTVFTVNLEVVPRAYRLYIHIDGIKTMEPVGNRPTLVDILPDHPTAYILNAYPKCPGKDVPDRDELGVKIYHPWKCVSMKFEQIYYDEHDNFLGNSTEMGLFNELSEPYFHYQNASTIAQKYHINGGLAFNQSDPQDSRGKTSIVKFTVITYTKMYSNLSRLQWHLNRDDWENIYHGPVKRLPIPCWTKVSSTTTEKPSTQTTASTTTARPSTTPSTATKATTTSAKKSTAGTTSSAESITSTPPPGNVLPFVEQATVSSAINLASLGVAIGTICYIHYIWIQCPCEDRLIILGYFFTIGYFGGWFVRHFVTEITTTVMVTCLVIMILFFVWHVIATFIFWRHLLPMTDEEKQRGNDRRF